MFSVCFVAGEAKRKTSSQVFVCVGSIYTKAEEVETTRKTARSNGSVRSGPAWLPKLLDGHLDETQESTTLGLPLELASVTFVRSSAGPWTGLVDHTRSS